MENFKPEIFFTKMKKALFLIPITHTHTHKISKKRKNSIILISIFASKYLKKFLFLFRTFKTVFLNKLFTFTLDLKILGSYTILSCALVK